MEHASHRKACNEEPNFLERPGTYVTCRDLALGHDITEHLSESGKQAIQVPEFTVDCGAAMTRRLLDLFINSRSGILDHERVLP